MVTPPGHTERIQAESVLVLAPHYDDELLGCGGLLLQLADQGAAVRALFLTDGGGGEEAIADRAAYRARRRQEAERVAELLGLAGWEHLNLPDGSLERHLAAIGAALRRALLVQRPDLLLAPSPLEASRDHRAAFAALHETLAPLRGDDPLDAAVAGLRVLLYEVNHPGYPDLLVDVSAEMPRLEEAAALYASQEERHPYAAAASGRRRFRTLSLPPGVAAAEGYRRLAVEEFVTRSRAGLIRELGGAPELLRVEEGPPVSLIVRTRDRPGLLAEALASIAASEYRRVEVVLVNDGGAPPPPLTEYPLPLVRLDLPESQGRAGAAKRGVERASGAFVGFLDDDDRIEPDHLATLAGLVGGTGVRVAYTDAVVGVYEPDGEDGWRLAERRLPYSRDFDADLLLFDNYIPFNTLLFERALLDGTPFDEELPFFEDWDLLIRLAEKVPFQHLRRVTCEYRHFRGGSQVFGERPRERRDFLDVKARVLARHAGRRTPEVTARIVDLLRGEIVTHREEATRSGRELAVVGERFHRLNGELAAVRGDRDGMRQELGALGEELRRLYAEEKALRGVVDDQTSHLGRVYAEIERLRALIAEMESTRAWRLHAWWQRRRS